MSLPLLAGAASVGSGDEPLYVDDVFSTYLYAGNGSIQTIDNDIALGSGVDVPPGTAMAGGFFGGVIKQGGVDYAVIVAPKATGQNGTTLRYNVTNGSVEATKTLNNGPVASAAINSASYPAAQFCEGLTTGGFSDWYLPSRDELEVCYRNLKPTETLNDINTKSLSAYTYPEGNDVAGDTHGTNRNSVPNGSPYTAGYPVRTTASAFISGGSEAFNSALYWSSSERSLSDGWGLNFSTGRQSDDNKEAAQLVRAVRRIPVSDSTLDPYRVTGEGGAVWIKGRNQPEPHVLVDTVRGAPNALRPNSTAASINDAGRVSAFTSSGFTTGGDGETNGSGTTYCSWTFREQAKFFDVVTYTGTGASNQNVSHNLGSVPGMMIVKRTDSAGQWYVYHRSLGNTAILTLNGTNELDFQPQWGNTTPTSTVFTVGGGEATNTSGGSYVAYLFAHDAGGFGTAGTDNVISCGTFTTDGSGNYSVNLGYEPQYVLVKRTNTTDDWWVWDVMRGYSRTFTEFLYPNLSSAAVGSTSTNRFPTATGFQGVADASSTFIYMAIRRPMKPPTSGTQVYTSIARTGTGSSAIISGVGFAPDTLIPQIRNDAWGSSITDRLRQRFNDIYTTGAESSTTGKVSSWDMNGVTVGNSSETNTSAKTYINHFFRRATGFFDVVCYTGTGVARTVAHNLGVAPELMIVKRRNTSGTNWLVYAEGLGNTKCTTLNTTDSQFTSSTFWNDTSPTSSVFSLGTSVSVNNSADTYVAYLFSTLAGISKVGSYTGNGTNQIINCGFTSGARFVMIKRVDTTGNWFVWDTVRGIVSGNDPYLSLNATFAEVTDTDAIDPTNSGFTINRLASVDVNENSGTYIFLAIA